MREDTLLSVSRRTEDTPKIHRDLLMRVPRRSGVSSYEDTRVPGRSGVSSRTALIHVKRERQLLMELEGLGQPFEGPMASCSAPASGTASPRPSACRPRPAPATRKNVFQQGAGLGPALGEPDLTFCDNRQIRVFLVLRYISPLTTSRSTVRPWMVRWSSPSSIEPSMAGRWSVMW